MNDKWKKALIHPAMSVLEAIQTINATSLQIALVVDDEQRLLGTITDGDVRRGILRGVPLTAEVSHVLNPQPATATASTTRDARLALMRRHQFHQLPIIDSSGRVVELETIDELIQPETHQNPVLLMAGGLGKRLRPLTETRPKPLLEVGGRPILETTVRRFVEQGFSRFFMSVCYKAGMIRDHFGDGSRFGAQIEYLQEEEPLGTAGALSLLPHPLEKPLIVMNGDILTNINLQRIVTFFEAQKASALMCVRDFELQIPYGVVKTENGQFTAIEEKPMQRFFVNAGLYVVTPDVARLVQPGEQIDMPDLFHRARTKDSNVVVFPISEYWLDIGRSEDYIRANAEFTGHFS
ncbi:MAG: nucleotidyltransferase family protein [Alphaproteobacteria bacterium]|nr:nucleotidyltransferase family protein [Alphaproteobacteria bacterium]